MTVLSDTSLGSASTQTRPGLGDDLARLGLDLAGGRPARIAITSYEFTGVVRNGGIGTACTSLARALADDGHEVDLIFTGWPEDPSDAGFDRWREHYRELGVRLDRLDLGTVAHCDGVLYNSAHSLALYELLKERDRERPYDAIHFVESLGHGLYSLMAKRQGVAFERATTVVGVHSPRRWLAEAHGVPFDHPIELGDEFLERRSVELADVVVSPSAHMLDWLEERGVRLPERSYVQQYVTNFDADRVSEDVRAPIEELVFFGRLESRKGLVTFCDALDLLADRDYSALRRVTFLGKQVPFGEVLSGAYVRARASEWPWECEVVDDLDRDAALEYLGAPGRLAVMASKMDNSPNTVYEAIGLGIPFLASRGGGTAELVHPDDFDRTTYEPGDPERREVDPGNPAATRAAHTGRVLAPRLESALAAAPRPARYAVDPATNCETHLVWHRAIAALEPERHALRAPIPDRIAVGALASGATGMSDLLLVLDPGLRPEPALAETLAAAAASTGAGFVTALGGFDVETPDGVVERVFLPSGGPSSSGLMGNCFGAGVVLARRDALERIGAFDTRDAPVKVSDLLARAALAGESIEVVPEVLYHLPSTAAPGGSLTGPADPFELIGPYCRSLSPEARDIACLARRLLSEEAALRAHAERADNAAAEAHRKLTVLTASRSYRMTGPLRRLAGRARRLAGEGKRAA